MIRIKIISIGKTKEQWLQVALEEYETRMQAQIAIEWLWAKDDEQLITYSQQQRSLCLDPQGTLLTSEQFASKLSEEWNLGGSRLAFIIGAAEGLPLQLKRSYPLISLSKMTFTHQLTRLVLIEQIYRAYDILRGGKYHK